MIGLRSSLVGGAILVLLGCQTLDADSDQPARITAPTEASRAALQAVVNAALHTNVRLADDALTRSSALTIELDPPGTLETPTPAGRIMTPPIQFRLVINASNCVLIDQRDGTRHVLHDTSCVAE
jgi:hypothetical protein